MEVKEMDKDTIYIDSPVGKIPRDWDVTTLGKITQITSGGTPDRKNSKYWNGDIPWITTSLIDFNVIEGAEEYITEEGLRNSATKLFEPGTILMALYGQGITRGKTAILNIQAATNQACAAIIIKNESINLLFLFQYLIAKYEDIRLLSNTGNQENLNGEIVKSIPLLIPPLPEQRRIAACLSSWGEVITKTTQLIAQKELQKKWLMQQLLTGKKRLRGFSGEWKKQKLGNFLIKHEEKSYLNNQYPVLTSSRRGLYLQTDYYTRVIASEDNTGYNVVPRGYFTYRHMSDDLIFRFNINDIVDKGIVSTLYPVFTVNGINDYFLLCKLNEGFEFKTFALENKQGGSRTYVYFSNLCNLKMKLPSLEEQVAIIQILQTADKEIQLLKAKADKLKEEKRWLMQQLLTGKKRLKIENN